MAYMCNTSNIKEMKYGRPQTIMFEGVDNHANGTIVTLKETMEGPLAKNDRAYDHVHAVEKLVSANQVIGKYIVVAPEINVEQYRRIDNQMDLFELKPGETYSAYKLEELDRIEYGSSHFDTLVGLTVGDFLVIDAQGLFTKTGANNATDSAFRVVSIVDTHLPFTLAANGQPNQGAALLPTVGKKIKLEVVR